jgi:hypothetical protein
VVLFDSEGNQIDLTREQMELIESLNTQQKSAEVSEKQQKLLQSINLEDLQNVELKQINQLLSNSGAQIPFQS